MSERTPKKTLPLLLLAYAMPMVAHASDESAIERAADATSELIAHTRVLFDCQVLIETIEPSPPSQAETFFVTLKTEGIECEQAFAELNDRGRARGLYFGLPLGSEADTETLGGTNANRPDEIDEGTEQ